MTHTNTIIIGAGLAGLSCAKRLCESGRCVALLEATDRVGGRVRTDVVDGFTMDHGFQVLLTAYPACQELLDYPALRLRKFDPGARVRVDGKFSILGDPWRKPSQALGTALSPVGSLSDKLKIVALRSASKQGSLEDLYQRDHQPTIDRLQADGFSEKMIDRFFRPFLGGVFLDESLATSSRMLEFVFRMFAAGDIAIPADGMGAIPRQLVDGLPQGTLRLNTTVASLTDRTVSLTNGETLTADNIVVATESSAAAKLLGRESLDVKWNSATTIYYAADAPPANHNGLMLRGDEAGPVQTAVVLSNVAPEYAPSGKSLISVSISDANQDDDLESLDQSVRVQLQNWFGQQVNAWKTLRCFRIPFGLPQIDFDCVKRPIESQNGIYICGDHQETPSIQGAMNSGLRVADAV